MKIELIACVALGLVKGLPVWFLYERGSCMSSNQSAAMESYAFRLKLKKAYGLNDVQFEMFIAGMKAIKSFINEDKDIYFSDEDDVQFIGDAEYYIKLCNDCCEFTMLIAAGKFEEASDSPSFDFLINVVKETYPDVDVSIKDSEPCKKLISNIQNKNGKDKDIMTKIIQKYNANIVEIIVCLLISELKENRGN